MFAELLQQPSQKYLIEAIDAYFDSGEEDKKRSIDPKSLPSFNESDLIEGSLEQINVKFCESLIDQEDSNISTEIESDENESSGGEKNKIVSINDYMTFTPESLVKFKQDYTLNIQYQFKLYNQYAQMMLSGLMNQKMISNQQASKISNEQEEKNHSPLQNKRINKNLKSTININNSQSNNQKLFPDNKFDCPLVD